MNNKVVFTEAQLKERLTNLILNEAGTLTDAFNDAVNNSKNSSDKKYNKLLAKLNQLTGDEQSIQTKANELDDDWTELPEGMDLFGEKRFYLTKDENKVIDLVDEIAHEKENIDKNYFANKPQQQNTTNYIKNQISIDVVKQFIKDIDNVGINNVSFETIDEQVSGTIMEALKNIGTSYLYNAVKASKIKNSSLDIDDIVSSALYGTEKKSSAAPGYVNLIKAAWDMTANNKSQANPLDFDEVTIDDIKSKINIKGFLMMGNLDGSRSIHGNYREFQFDEFSAHFQENIKELAKRISKAFSQFGYNEKEVLNAAYKELNNEYFEVENNDKQIDNFISHLIDTTIEYIYNNIQRESERLSANNESNVTIDANDSNAIKLWNNLTRCVITLAQSRFKNEQLKKNREQSETMLNGRDSDEEDGSANTALDDATADAGLSSSNMSYDAYTTLIDFLSDLSNQDIYQILTSFHFTDKGKMSTANMVYTGLRDSGLVDQLNLPDVETLQNNQKEKEKEKRKERRRLNKDINTNADLNTNNDDSIESKEASEDTVHDSYTLFSGAAMLIFLNKHGLSIKTNTSDENIENGQINDNSNKPKLAETLVAVAETSGVANVVNAKVNLTELKELFAKYGKDETTIPYNNLSELSDLKTRLFNSVIDIQNGNYPQSFNSEVIHDIYVLYNRVRYQYELLQKYRNTSKSIADTLGLNLIDLSSRRGISCQEWDDFIKEQITTCYGGDVLNKTFAFKAQEKPKQKNDTNNIEPENQITIPETYCYSRAMQSLTDQIRTIFIPLWRKNIRKDQGEKGKLFVPNYINKGKRSKQTYDEFAYGNK